MAASLSLLDVPFISQSEALCGGAAATMVLRYWGARDVVAEDFAPLVDRQAGGIRAADLVRAVQARGWSAIAAAGTAPLVQKELASGRPVIALVEDRPGAYHYVVIVGWHEQAVVVHDPARTPYVLMQPAEFERRWKASGRWMLAVAPGAATPQPVAPDVEPAAARDSCDALVAEGVRFAQQENLAQAERLLAGAAYECPGAGPWRELAGVRLLQRRWPEVRDLAGRAVAIDPNDTHAWRLLATGRFIQGNRKAALEAWNRVGEPVIDLVTVSGLQRTTHRTVERLMGLDSGTPLTPASVHRASRRLADLPAALSTRLEYVPRPEGRADVQAHVAERTVVPSGRLTWVATGLQAAASREVTVGLTNLAEHGERLTARWRFWPGRPGYGLSLTAPAASLGIVTLEALGERQPFAETDLPAAERVMARVRLGNWASGAVRWEARGGVDRWTREGLFGVVGGGLRLETARSVLLAGADVWAGENRFAAAHLRGRWRSSPARRGFVLDLRGGVEAIQAGAPLALWPAADTGHARAALLRAHPIIDGGRLRLDRLGRSLAHLTVEAQRWWRPLAPLAAGGAVFVDAARTARLRAGSPLDDVDIGLGARVALGEGSGFFRVDAARGLRDGRTALTVAWQPW